MAARNPDRLDAAVNAIRAVNLASAARVQRLRIDTSSIASSSDARTRLRHLITTSDTV